MYTQFFKLNQAPFSIAPDPRYLFMSERHREALAHLLYGVGGGGGFVLLTGEIGAGKTTVCRCFLEQIPDNCNVAYIFNPKQTAGELLKSICDEFRIALPASAGHAPTIKDHVDALNDYLLTAHASGRNNVLIIDEAQNLSADVLEQLRLLTNLETNDRKLLQIVLIGQPELRTMLARPELEQLAQRVIARYHLDSLSPEETVRYVLHRLAIAGPGAASPFSQGLMRKIHQLTKGVPRRINLLCDRALLGAYAEGRHEVTAKIVRKAAAEVFDAEHAAPARHTAWRHALAGLLVGVALVGGALLASGQRFVFPEFAVAPKRPDVAVRAPASAQTRSGSMPVAAASSQAASVAEIMGAAQAAATAGAIMPAAIPVRSDLNGVITDAARDDKVLYREMAQMWGVTLPEGEPCTVAVEKKLHCYKSARGLVEIRQLDRPAVLALADSEGKPFYALLTGMNNASATLRIGGLSYSVGVIALGGHFLGDFTTFRGAPANFRERVNVGDRGDDVDWIATQLAKLNGVKGPEAGQPFDKSMARQVRDFQLAQGLRADGVVGPRTFMLLNNAAGVNEPRLHTGPDASPVVAGK
jgi:general secretion pathway protein A